MAPLHTTGARAATSALLLGTAFLLIGLGLATYGLLQLLLGNTGYDQSNTWLGLFTAVGGGQMVEAYALAVRGVPEFDFWQARQALQMASPRDRRLIWLQVPFQAGALAGIAMYVVLSPGGYLPIYVLALTVTVALVAWNTFQARTSAAAHVFLFLLAAAMLLRFARLAFA